MDTVITIVLTFIGTKIAEYLWQVIQAIPVASQPFIPDQPKQKNVTSNLPGESGGVSIVGIRRNKNGGYTAVDHYMNTQRGDIINLRRRLES